MKKTKQMLAMGLSVSMVAAMLAGCGGSQSDSKNESASNTTQKSDADTPLVVGYDSFSEKFSPFFAESQYDMDVSDMTQMHLLSSDRTGAIIYKGIEGETIKYNDKDYTYYGPADLEVKENEDGSVNYDFTLREDLKFSDGKPITADDVIFSMYVLCDPTYDGSSTLYAQPIKGIEAYRNGMTSKWELILKDGPEKESKYYTADEAKKFWETFDKAGEAFAQEIVDYCKANYPDDAKDVASAAALWGYKGLDEKATAADFFAKIVEAYGYDISDNGINKETAGTSISAQITSLLSSELLAGVTTGKSADKIEGIQKKDDYHFSVIMDKVDAAAIYQLACAITPLHYYGSTDLYDYDNNKFGFPKGDLSLVRAKTTEPMGAGAYKFVKFANSVVSFEANDNYYKGVPKTKYINFLETQEKDKLNGILTGSIDITDPVFNKDNVDAIEKANGGELNGKKVNVNTVDNLGYGYIGINSKNVSVDGKPGSEQSKALRKAFATIFSVYRDVSVDSYYGERASVINYPISNTSWAAPQPTDEGYKLAFSTDVNGKDIYTSDMDADAKYKAAQTAALGFFEKAGYTVKDGKVTKAPKGASMEYELLIPADGSGDHPAFMLANLAKESLKEIGVKLIVTDLSNSADLWTGLTAQTVSMWAAAWSATVDPDMYQIYHPKGGSNYQYAINDEELNKLIMEARETTDQTYRKAMYKACLDIIIDWACEIPVYQRQNAVVFSTERVNLDSVTPDITPFYGWMSEVENIELK